MTWELVVKEAVAQRIWTYLLVSLVLNPPVLLRHEMQHGLLSTKTGRADFLLRNAAEGAAEYPAGAADN